MYAGDAHNKTLFLASLNLKQCISSDRSSSQPSPAGRSMTSYILYCNGHTLITGFTAPGCCLVGLTWHSMECYARDMAQAFMDLSELDWANFQATIVTYEHRGAQSLMYEDNAHNRTLFLARLQLEAVPCFVWFNCWSFTIDSSYYWWFCSEVLPLLFTVLDKPVTPNNAEQRAFTSVQLLLQAMVLSTRPNTKYLWNASSDRFIFHQLLENLSWFLQPICVSSVTTGWSQCWVRNAEIIKLQDELASSKFKVKYYQQEAEKARLVQFMCKHVLTSDTDLSLSTDQLYQQVLFNRNEITQHDAEIKCLQFQLLHMSQQNCWTHKSLLMNDTSWGSFTTVLIGCVLTQYKNCVPVSYRGFHSALLQRGLRIISIIDWVDPLCCCSSLTRKHWAATRPQATQCMRVPLCACRLVSFRTTA